MNYLLGHKYYTLMVTTNYYMHYAALMHDTTEKHTMMWYNALLHTTTHI